MAGDKKEPSAFHTMPLRTLKEEVSLYEDKFNRMLVRTPASRVECRRLPLVHLSQLLR